MAVRIFNNIPSVTAQRILGQNNDRLAKSIERISSGIRINGKIVNSIAFGYLPKKGSPGLSLSYLIKSGDLRFSRETAIQLKSFSQYIQLIQK